MVNIKHKCNRCNKKKATSIIRQRDVCNICYDIINRDNYHRIRLGKSIPRDFALIIEMDRNGKLVWN